jgi:hypothetical protein
VCVCVCVCVCVLLLGNNQTAASKGEMSPALPYVPDFYYCSVWVDSLIAERVRL